MGIFDGKGRNRRRGATLASRNGEGRAAKIVTLAVLLLVLIAAAAWGANRGISALTALCRGQCRIRDVERDVEVVSSGKMIKPENIIRYFAITNGANTAEIEFAALRERILDQLPQIKSLVITRTLPSKVRVEIVEREPAVRLTGEGRVADADGVVFDYYRNTSMLPRIAISAASSDMGPGKKLNGRAAAALRLILETLRAGENATVRILNADTTHNDYLLLTLADYSSVKFAWDGMDEDTEAAHQAMASQLECLAKTIAATKGAGVRQYNATVPGRISAKPPAM